VDLYNYENIE